jgi:signal transduction histidine kinase
MMRSARLRGIAAILALAVGYTVAARLGLMLDAVSGFATLVWAPTGIALACLLRAGEQLWPGIAIGAFVANIWVGAPWLAAIGIAVGNTAEALIGAWLLRRYARFQRLDGLRPTLGLVFLAAGASTVVSATVGVASLWLAGAAPQGQLLATWRAWWLGDAAGDLLVAPLLLAWTTDIAWRRPAIKPLRLLELVALASILATLAFAVFFGLFLEGGFSHSYLVFPPLIWAALRFRERGATLATLFVSAVGIWATARGHGPFVMPRLATGLLHLQAFMTIVAITILLLAAAITERARAVAARQAMLEVVSHDLRNPLSAIRLVTTAMLQSPPRDPAAVRKHIERVSNAAERMESLVKNLLDLAAIESGHLEIRRERLDAGVVLREAAELMRPIAAARTQTIDCEVETATAHLVADHERMLQILSNLIGNAIKFAPEASSIAVSVKSAGNSVLFSVKDHGPGLSRDQIARVFDRFWQAKRTGSGLGLGLWISREIIQAHGGRIWVESTPGAGATFCFTLPRESEPRSPATEPVTA